MLSTNTIYMHLGLENMQENQLNFLQTLAHGCDTRSNDPTSTLEAITGMKKPLGVITGVIRAVVSIADKFPSPSSLLRP